MTFKNDFEEKKYYLFVIKERILDYTLLPACFKADPEIALHYVLATGEFNELNDWFFPSPLIMKFCMTVKRNETQNGFDIDDEFKNTLYCNLVKNSKLGRFARIERQSLI